MRNWWKYVARERIRRRLEHLAAGIANRLPRWLAYRATIRVGVHATTGAYSTQVVPELTLMDALQRWGK